MRFAIVTGTTRGLGRAIGRALLDRGWHVLGVARGPEPAELRDARYAHARLDLADHGAMTAWFEHEWPARHDVGACERLGLVNNAGVLAPIAPAPDLDAAALARAFAVNAIAPIWLTGFVVRLGARTKTRIVHLSSGAAGTPYAGWTAYCATKAALAMAGRVLAAELDEVPSLRRRDVALVSYAPHVVDTDMQREIRAVSAEQFPRRDRFVAFQQQGNLVPPEQPAAEIAELLGRDDLPHYEERRFVPRR